ncbi:MrpH family fimbial adhesin [Serratia ficaria]|uniref:MrpH family fimbial adhesin n=1 Tax=Serratia ficaria TaxID=61651 RepID=UPI0021C82ED7|nr:hypothetical protein [Serratia ficaria]
MSILVSDVFHSNIPMEPIYMGYAKNSKTLGELGQYVIDNGYLNKEYHYRQNGGGGNICFYLGYAYYNDVHVFRRLPGAPSYCPPPKIDPAYCSVYIANPELGHGIISPDKVNGNTVRTSMNVRCSADLNVMITSTDRSGSVYLGRFGVFRSELKVDGVNLGEGKTFVATPQGVGLTLSSTLTGYDGSVGTFRGSKTIIVSLP